MIFLDMDGVLADFVGGVCKLFNRDKEELYSNWVGDNYSLTEAMGITNSDLWKTINTTQNFWAELEPLPWKDELLDIISSCDRKVFILTSPGPDVQCPSGKLEWLMKHTKLSNKMVIAREKWLCASPGRTLIDDSDNKCRSFEIFGGQSIVFPQHWNTNHKLIDNRLSYVQQQLRIDR